MNVASANKLPSKAKSKTLWVVVGLLLAVGGFALWNYVTHPPKPWLVRWRVTRYLKKEAGTSNLKIEFPFPSKKEMAQASPRPKEEAEAAKNGKLTGKDFDTLKSEYITLKTSVVVLEREIARSEAELKGKSAQLEQLSKELAQVQAGADATNNVALLAARVENLRAEVAGLNTKSSAQPELKTKQEALVPIVTDLWDFQRTWIAENEAAEGSGSNLLAKARVKLAADTRTKLDEAGSYGAIYKLIGQELWVADKLFASANPDHQRTAIRIALQASQHAVGDAQNGWLAGSICAGYIWPHLDAADTTRRSQLSLENLLNECVNIFRQNNDWPSVVRSYEILLEKSKGTPRADAARAQITMTYEQAGDLKLALHYLREIQATNDYAGMLRRIPRLEKQLKAN